MDQFEIAVDVGGFGPLARPHGIPAMGEVVAEDVVVDDPPEGEQKLGIGLISEATTAEDTGLVECPAALVDDDRGADGRT